jgi:outer membrane protein OmpA-like peptidoglycan-associated protein
LYFKPSEPDSAPSDFRAKKPLEKKARPDFTVPSGIHSVGKEPAVIPAAVSIAPANKPIRSAFLGNSGKPPVASPLNAPSASSTSHRPVTVVTPATKKISESSSSTHAQVKQPAPKLRTAKPAANALKASTATVSNPIQIKPKFRHEKLTRAAGSVWFLSNLQVTGPKGKKQASSLAELLAADPTIIGIRLVGYAGSDEVCGGMPPSQLGVARALTVRKEMAAAGVDERLISIRQPEVVPGDKDKRHRVDVYVVRATTAIQ